MAKVIIPTPLRKFTDNQAVVELESTSVGGALNDLSVQFPEIKQHLLKADGNIRDFIKVYVEDDDIQALEKERTPVNSDSTISIVPAIAGGC
ncbi:MoaD/ThiS family protein [Xanthovirga aplysinae]|uniref:MoaD/ThiS family protein n=1 Tax=Xanthovirga aplysinae TaxID=2529853 RepID=UPI0012BB4B6B|nr:MoaD/ThiS family protein [Xanthovirga aplysinae]MTI30194.1 molybdopterin synthase sulfur carrier subunit [Xanthovirga aplysinae]